MSGFCVVATANIDSKVKDSAALTEKLKVRKLMVKINKSLDMQKIQVTERFNAAVETKYNIHKS
jgi:hypothetical protein